VADGQEFIPIDEIQAGNWSVSGSELTIQAWANFDNLTIDDPRIFSKANGTSEQSHVYMLGLGGTGEQYLRARIKTGADDGSGTTTLVASSNPLTAGTWYHVALTYNGTNMVLYRNGVNSGSTGKTGSLRENAWDMKIGNNPGSSTSYACTDGKLDEVRLLSVARSEDWLTTEYNNQDSPSSFCNIESQTLIPGYASSGTLASQVLDTGVSSSVWNILYWDETLQSDTDIAFEARASDTVFLKDAATPSWVYIGSTSPVTSGLPAGRYMQWRAILNTSNSTLTPTLHEARLYHY
jgi:hypothetical protein